MATSTGNDPAVHEDVSSPPWFIDPIGDAFAIAGLVGIGVGITYLSKASTTKRNADQAEVAGTIDLDTWKQAYDKASHQRTIGAVGLASGVALGGGSIYFFMRHHRSHQTLVASDGS